ncbi:beta-1,4-mannosyltransferase egh [Nasonia vitripennis]|uniref:Glycosyltransferase 2-like domain-containing protein n=1 Tax=Nasonia vitripennis TaxID=7425 RepID=A0A7M7LTY2_NASVI|nr:beta-1,4-mannosyltransferase egh [Nasonia vitripennis]XP_008203441.1 beta-1,4-mannosyltransferase egh [Nasonia vitripennis]
MMLNSWTKHILHCCLLATFILVFEFVSGGLHWGPRDQSQFDPWVQYGFAGALTLYLLRTLTFLSFPQVLFNFIGLTIYNAFPDKVSLKGSPLLAPFICIRVVTRGDYPQLVKTNVDKNLNKCIDAGLENFQIEVVSDKPIGLSAHRRIREVIVPPNYRTTSGALFKARALQYCLENSVNELADHDWIVHLDEETLLTDNSIRGILNFVLDGKHQFGQGLITYANEDVVNWITTLADSFRVADDMGKLRLQFTMFHKPLFSMKGSYVVTQMGAERQVSFNNGLDGSVAEDCFFAMKAFSQGYSFNFIDGEMWEKSPFTLWDFVQQRKRWLQGILLVVHSKAIPVKKKLLLAISCYSWVTMPLSTSNIVLAGLCPITCPPVMDFLCAFIGAVNIYMYIFGVVKSFSLYRFGVARFMLFICGALMTIPFNLIIENVAVIWGLFGKKHKFYVVNKEFKPALAV